jgi:hypothetical protein
MEYIAQLEEFYKSDDNCIILYIGEDPYERGDVQEWAENHGYIARGEYICDDTRIEAVQCYFCDTWNIVGESRMISQHGFDDLSCSVRSVMECKRCKEEIHYCENDVHKYIDNGDIEFKGDISPTGRMLIMKEDDPSCSFPQILSKYKIKWWSKTRTPYEEEWSGDEEWSDDTY